MTTKALRRVLLPALIPVAALSPQAASAAPHTPASLVTAYVASGSAAATANPLAATPEGGRPEAR